MAMRIYSPPEGVTMMPIGYMGERFVPWEECFQDLKDRYDSLEALLRALERSSPSKPLIGDKGAYWRDDYDPYPLAGHGPYL